MKDNYEIIGFRKRYVLLVVLLLAVIWPIAWYCCDFHVGKATLLGGVFALFSICLYLPVVRMQKSIYMEMDKLSGLMIDVVDGKLDDSAERYCEGTLGILYTNFYKMVTILRESKQKEGKEKEFLKETISDISHQLKTPLASLGVFVDLLYEDKLPEEKQKEVLQEARKQLDRMEWMVLAMLKLARIEAGSVRFEKTVCDMAGIIGAAIDGVSYLTRKKNQFVEVEWPQDNKQIQLYCDGEWLTEAILNLLKNASDYSKEDTTIRVSVEENGLFTRIHIQDEGVGIPEEALPHIFKRFYRVDNTVNPGSVGIGLSLSKSIVEGMGGKIKAKSEVGKYTCFTLTFYKNI